MENKNNFAGIILPVIIAVILLTVLPIINSINKECPPCSECPPCEECPSYNIGNVEVNPDFSSGDYIVDKGSHDYINSATIIKDIDLVSENIKKGVNIFGVVGTLEGSSGYSVSIINCSSYNTSQGYLSYSLDNGSTWVDIDTENKLNIILSNVTQIRFKLTKNNNSMFASLWDISNRNNRDGIVLGQSSNWTGSNIILSENKIYEIAIYAD